MIKEHRSNYPNCVIRKLTGPPENWITAIENQSWAVQPKNAGRLKQLNVGDILIFHCSQSFYSEACGIIGYGIIGSANEVKKELWWKDEIEQKTNIYPHLIRFSQMFLLGNLDYIDLATPIQNKNHSQIESEAKALLHDMVQFDEITKKFNYKFPRMGSLSRLTGVDNDALIDYIASKPSASATPVPRANECVENLGADSELLKDERPTEEDLAEIRKKSEAVRTQEEAAKLLEVLQAQLQQVDPKRRRRIANAIVRIPKIAKLVKEREGYRCQVCKVEGFEKREGGRYAEVHHVEELGRGGKDLPDNMLCLCASCHRKIHYGIRK